MKKKLLSLLTAMCLMATMVPAAFATGGSDLQTRIDNAAEGATITLTGNETIPSTLVINKGITLDGNGNTLTMTGGTYAIDVQTNAAVAVKDIQIDAKATGGRGIYISATQPHFTLLNSTLNVNNRGIGFSNAGTIAGATLTVDQSTIQNSQKPGDKTYENWSHQGDSRGISIWNVKNSTINIVNGSEILGFGYPINMAGDVVNGVRDMEDSTINITDSDVWGWCAMNIWTIDTTFNITNSNLKGFVETDNVWNSFATVVLNQGIYGDITNSSKANVFNISGGSVSSTCVSNNEDVFHCLFRLDKEFMSEFTFNQDDNMNPVALDCTQPFSAFLMTYEGMTLGAFTTWAQTKLSCSADVATYRWGAIAPGVDVNSQSMMALSNVSVSTDTMCHEGGQGQ